jgi:hypothetical protein
MKGWDPRRAQPRHLIWEKQNETDRDPGLPRLEGEGREIAGTWCEKGPFVTGKTRESSRLIRFQL